MSPHAIPDEAERDHAAPAIAALGWRSIPLWREIVSALDEPRPFFAQRGSLLLAHRGDAGSAQRVLDRLHGDARAAPQALDADGLRALDPAGTEANLVAILDKLAAERVPALLTGMLAPPNLGPQYGDQFRAVFERLGKRPGLIYDPFFLEGVAGDPKLNQPDRIHPNAEGVQRIVARLLPRMEQLIALIPP